MSAPPKAGGAPITSKRQLVEYFEQGSKPRSEWRVGTEHEKFVFDLETLRTVSYEQPNGIGALLRGLQRFGWQPVEEHGNVIALTMDGWSRAGSSSCRARRCARSTRPAPRSGATCSR